MALDFLTAREKTLITGDFSDLVADTQIGVAITYKAFSSKGAFSPTTGKVTETYTDSSINAFRMPLSDREVRDSGGKYQVGDYRYFIRVSDIATPKKDDRVVDGSVTRYVITWSVDPLRVFHSLVARNLG